MVVRRPLRPYLVLAYAVALAILDPNSGGEAFASQPIRLSCYPFPFLVGGGHAIQRAVIAVCCSRGVIEYDVHD